MEPGFSNQFALPFAEIFLHRCTPHFSLVKHHFKISEPDKRQGRRLPLGKGKSATDFNVLKISQDQADKGGSALPLEVSLVRIISELLCYQQFEVSLVPFHFRLPGQELGPN